MERADLQDEGPVTFQGQFGAYSDQMARQIFPGRDTLPCPSFEEALAKVHDGSAAYAVIPVENSLAGRVADVHHLLPTTPLYIVGEAYLAVRHCLLGLGTMDDIREVHSHIHALPQCRRFIKDRGFTPVIHPDTAGAAKMVAKKGDKSWAAIASAVAGEVYGLTVLAENIQDNPHNFTRFLVFSRGKALPPQDAPCLTTLLFKVKDIPSALYKALGCFADNRIQLTKLESYRDIFFNTAEFLCDVEAHPQDPDFQKALTALHQVSDQVALIGSYAKAALPKE